MGNSSHFSHFLSATLRLSAENKFSLGNKSNEDIFEVGSRTSFKFSLGVYKKAEFPLFLNYCPVTEILTLN